ncbi:uncharacterized protein [Rutidosis leptorrhynchoides]|uniref:uncharacterized protein n=1 Tax=Rutidosis leptorrhynchoides TaxID=125765 RepID=UPI003A99B11F
MKSMGFGCKWRRWILSCLSSASVSILVNGSPTNEFTLGRGVRQGDPLSPFLFILVAEGLNILTKEAIDRGANALSLQNLLKCFELASGLKINFQKSCLFGVGVNSDEVNIMASRMWCQVGSFPFTYLGLPIGSKMKKANDWIPVIEKFKNRLSNWIGCPLEEDWDGGLNIGSLHSKNLALLGKWWWRFKTETNALWVKVIHSIYGSNGGLDVESELPHSSYLGTWRNIIIAEVDQAAAVVDRLAFDGQNLIFNWCWSRAPSRRAETELAGLSELLAHVKLDRTVPDSWAWLLSDSHRFSVKELSGIIDHAFLLSHHYFPETLRNSLVPKKLEIFVCRLILKRIPVQVELDKKGIDLHSMRCPICDDDLESIEHTFLFCSNAMDIWSRVYNWWGIGNFSNFGINEILRGNTSNVATSNFGGKIWQAIEWICVYYIWKIRNDKVFHGKTWSIPVALSEIQIKSFEWVGHRAKKKKFDWLTWLNDPRIYLTS